MQRYWPETLLLPASVPAGSNPRCTEAMLSCRCDPAGADRKRSPVGLTFGADHSRSDLR